MENVIWLVITIPCSLLFTGIGIYAWRRRKPMWFWSGSSVKEEEITANEGFLPHFYERHGFGREKEVILMGMEL